MNFNDTVEKYEEYYFHKWRGNEKPAPAFDNEIVKATRSGWKHIRYARGRQRNKLEISKRLGLLPVVRRIIETRRKINEYRRQGRYEYWTYVSKQKGKSIKVVVRAALKGESHKHFYSVFKMKKWHKKRPVSRLS